MTKPSFFAKLTSMKDSMSSTSIQFIKGVGPAKAQLLSNLGIENIEDVFYLFPSRYEDRRKMLSIEQAIVGQFQTIKGKVVSVKGRRTSGRKHITEVVLKDVSGRIVCTWFNQPYLEKSFHKDKTIICYGKADKFKNRLQMVSPEYEVLSDDASKASLSLNRIVPIYPLTKGISQNFLRKLIDTCLKEHLSEMKDELGSQLRKKYKLAHISKSIEALHFPAKMKDHDEAIRRVSFEEFYFFQICVILRRLSIVLKEGTAHKVTDSKTSKFIKGFGFDLTNAQKKVIREVRDDMAKPSPMLRLLQGDVGSGKTVAALFGCYNAYLNKKQSAIMAPTEILARQHFESIKKAIVDGPIKDAQVALLVGSMKKKEKNTVLGAIERGDVDIVIGTHSLISEQTQFKDLTYVVVDEQHKFGVRQRAILSEKGNNPDVLIMTATPIPRTLCITLYGDLDLSIIDEMPKGRGKVHTKKFGHGGVETVYGFVRSKVKEGRQVFFVYPIIEESEILDLKAAEDMYAQFKTETFKDLKIGIVHGKLKRDETDVIMGRFRAGEIDILIATTVVEVGVDVANATVMVIENAERFGLSQLHQLRGRIGRGEHEGYCCLVSDPTTEEGIKRLKALVSTTDGFKIAQNDLEIRGPGRYFGRHQHGLNELRVANPITQLDILKLAREEALLVTKKDPYLEHAGNRNIKRVIFRRYPTFLTDVEAG